MEIAIIGGVAAGISVIDTILRQDAMHNGQVTLTLIEPNKRVGPGRAYKGDGDYALLNRQARFMSIRTDEPSHFIDWMRSEADPDAAQQEFVPRSLFGDYLTAQFRKQIEKSRKLGSPINVLSTAATAMYCGDSGKVRVVTAQGTSLKFDAAVLCIGTAEPTDVFGLSGSADFISQPYPIWLTCAGIKPDEHVAFWAPVSRPWIRYSGCAPKVTLGPSRCCPGEDYCQPYASRIRILFFSICPKKALLLV